MYRRCSLVAAGLLLLQSPAPWAAAQGPDVVEHFEARVRPLLIEKCLGCHDGSEESESDLAITSRQALIDGGDYGPTLVPGRAEASLLMSVVRRTHKELRMPPEEEDRLTATEVADLARWIDTGAPWPGGQAAAVARHASSDSLETDHWSFRAPQRLDPPHVAEPEWNQTAIDRFVYAKQRERGLTPASLADRRTLIRRATFDLTGLPPTYAETQAFVSDDTEGAYERLIDRLLESPHYGERWGRHWLDVARYADTQGDTGDFPIPDAYLYRDWVIQALNEDLPYDRFLHAQIAGDRLAEQADPSQARELIVATGLIALARRFGNTTFDDHHLTIEDTIDTIGRGVLGLTLRCARCHDHKFDPLLQTDYYRLYGIFASTRYPTMGASDQKTPANLVPVSTEPGARKRADDYFALLARYYDQIRNHHRPWLQPTLVEYRQVTSELQQAEGLSIADRQRLAVRRSALLHEFDGRFRELMLHGLDWLKREHAQLADNPPDEMVFAVSDQEPVDARLHKRGSPDNLGPVVERGFPEVLTRGESIELDGSGRLEFARWLTAPENPLTARVMVNRIWQHHFGRGIVATPSNFGVQGARPSHPELLDYLARVFVEDAGWSLKEMHRRMMLTRAYRAASEDVPESSQRDPDNVFLWKFARRRLAAEEIRDSILLASGRLETSAAGAFAFPHWKHGLYSLNQPFKAEYSSDRRSIYLVTQRLFRNPFFALFDGPDRSQTTAERKSSTLPTQSLYLLNSPFVEVQSRAFAERIRELAKSETEAIQTVYRFAYARQPTESESQVMALHVQRLKGELGEPGGQGERVELWSAVAKAIFASNEFLFVD